MTGSDKTVFINLSTDDPLKAGKALRFAMQSLSYAMHTVLYLSTQGTKVADKSTGGFTIPTKTINSLDLIREFLKEGGKVYVGQDCMKSLGIAATDLVAGCEQAEPKNTFSLLLSDDTVTISW